jgi:hypothetical protein
MSLKSAKTAVGGKEPAALPAAVAATAARVEAEGKPALAAAVHHGSAAHHPPARPHPASGAKPASADRSHHGAAKEAGPKAPTKKRER